MSINPEQFLVNQLYYDLQSNSGALLDIEEFSIVPAEGGRVHDLHAFTQNVRMVFNFSRSKAYLQAKRGEGNVRQGLKWNMLHDRNPFVRFPSLLATLGNLLHEQISTILDRSNLPSLGLETRMREHYAGTIPWPYQNLHATDLARQLLYPGVKSERLLPDLVLKIPAGQDCAVAIYKNGEVGIELRNASVCRPREGGIKIFLEDCKVHIQGRRHEIPIDGDELAGNWLSIKPAISQVDYAWEHQDDMPWYVAEIPPSSTVLLFGYEGFDALRDGWCPVAYEKSDQGNWQVSQD